MTEKQRRLLLAIAILLLATWLRFHNLTAQSFWNDEGNSARLSERSLRLIIEGTASDVHPPLYYFVLRGWRELVGASEFALRSVSAFAGILIVALVVPLARVSRIGLVNQHDLGLLAAFFVAFNPAMLYYSQEARMYTLLPLWATLATVLLLFQLQRGELVNLNISAKHSKKVLNYLSVTPYILVSAAGLYTHYFFPIIFAMHGLIVLIHAWQKPLQVQNTIRIVRRWVLQVVLAIMLFVPWLPYVLNGLGGNRGEPQAGGIFLRQLSEWIWLGLAHSDSGMIALWSVGVVLTALYFRPKTSLTFLILILLPVIALIAVGATDSEFYKFLLLIIPPASITFATTWLRLFKRAELPMQIGTAFFVLMAFALSFSRWQVANAEFARDDYRGMAGLISAENHPNAAIILNAPNQWEVFTYYHREDDPTNAPVYPIPLSHDYATTITELEQIAATHERIYTLYWGDTQQDPDHWVENWLKEHTFVVSDTWYGDVRFVVYAVPSGKTDELQVPVEALFGEQIQLHGYGLNSAELHPADILELSLFWSPIDQITTRYKIFVHLLAADGAFINQRDSEPTPFTLDWTTDREYVTNYGLLIPADTPAGTYQLLVGLYAADSPQARLTLSENRDSFTITKIEVIR